VTGPRLGDEVDSDGQKNMDSSHVNAVKFASPGTVKNPRGFDILIELNREFCSKKGSMKTKAE
jgi:hypothetical protein